MVIEFYRFAFRPDYGLLKLSEEIQRFLLGLNDQRGIHYFSERRLRPLLAIPDETRQVQEFNRMKQWVA